MSIIVKRVYDAAATDDGYRILVDRLWPRGMTREAARVDLWLRDIGPTTELRKWFGHEPDRWPQFRTRYADELKAHGELLDLVQDLERHHERVTLLYGARDRVHNEAHVIAAALEERPAHAHH